MEYPRLPQLAEVGWRLLFVTSINASNAALYDNLNFNFIRDIVPVASIDRFPFVMKVNPSVPRFHDRLSTDIGGRARPVVDDKWPTEPL